MYSYLVFALLIFIPTHSGRAVLGEEAVRTLELGAAGIALVVVLVVGTVRAGHARGPQGSE